GKRSWEDKPLPGGPARVLRHPYRPTRSHFSGDRRNEAVALASNVGDIPFPAVAVAKRFAETGHVDPEVTRVDDQIAPHARDQLAMSDKLARAFDQHHQNVEGTVAQCERYAIPFEGAGCREQPEWSKGDRDALGAGRSTRPEGRKCAVAEHRIVAFTVNLA